MTIITWGRPLHQVRTGDSVVSMPIRPTIAVDTLPEDKAPEGATKTPLDILDIATDSEWHSDGTWLSTSFAANIGGKLRCYHFLFRRLPDNVIDTWEGCANEVGDSLYLWDDEQEGSKLDTVIHDITTEFPWVLRTRELNLLMFYSPKDLEYAHGGERMEALYKKSKGGVEQKRNIRGSFWCAGMKVKIRDLKGWTQGGLLGFAEAVGVDPGDKGEMDDYKSRMRDGFIEHPEVAFKYSRNDVVILHHVQDKFEKQIKNIARETLKIPRELWNKLKGTTGSLTADIFQEWLHSKFWSASQGWNGFDTACMKLGRLDQASKDYETNLTRFNEDPSQLDRDAFEFLAYSQCSVGYLSRFASQGDSTAFNCLVQGGRCNNERPGEYSLDDGADIDLSSCYGTALKEFVYPIGLPTTWGYQSEQLRPTLGEFLKTNESGLVPGLWTITVSGKLTFSQDLIFSKIVELSAIASASGGGFDKDLGDDDRDDDLSHIPGDFALLRKEIVNGIITQDILNALRKVASDRERSELLKLKVVCAAAYLKKDEVQKEEWAGLVVQSTGKLENVGGNSANRVDKRSRAWCGIPIDGFVGELVKKRTELKRKAKEVREEEKSKLDAQQNGLKLLINTLYGCLASPYFPIGNTVIANNITARARLGTWMLNKALHTRQSITDGGIYTPTQVPFLTPSAKLPGLELLADNTNWLEVRKGRVLRPMAEDWKAEDLDAIALNHVNEFWGRYGMKLPFNIEHKLDNTFTRAAYWGKADYALIRSDGKPYFKIRGAKNYTNGKRRSPKYELLENILNESDEFPSELGYDHSYLLKIGKWRIGQSSRGYEALKGKRPGDEVNEVRNARFNNTHFPCNSVKEFKRRQERKTKLKGENVRWFEKDGGKGIRAVHQVMKADTQNQAK
jgi:hypothetical protein